LPPAKCAPCATPPAGKNGWPNFLSVVFRSYSSATPISRDGRGRATDNAFIERLWRTLKWEHIYLNPADDGQHLFHQLDAYFAYYNYQRPHQSLRGQTPAQVFHQTMSFKYNNII